MHESLQMQNSRSAAFNFGCTTFDDVVLGFFTIFHIVTLERWSSVLFMMQDVGNDAGAIMFVFVLLIMGHFFCLNLMLAILSDSVGATLTNQDETDYLHGRRCAMTTNDIYCHLDQVQKVNCINASKRNLENLLKSRVSLVTENMQNIFSENRLALAHEETKISATSSIKKTLRNLSSGSKSNYFETNS